MFRPFTFKHLHCRAFLPGCSGPILPHTPHLCILTGSEPAVVDLVAGADSLIQLKWGITSLPTRFRLFISDSKSETTKSMVR